MVFGRAVSLLLALAACSTASTPASVTGELIATNQGGDLEGHTPRGFAGMGTGLFVGDNLNPSFPDGDGVQAYLTFELAAAVTTFDNAVVTSDALVVSGSAFEDLGPLTIEAVQYASFGPDLFDLAATSEPAVCQRVGGDGVECDVTRLLDGALSEGRSRAQFRLRMTAIANRDDQTDLAAFFRVDANTNEPGLFTLTIGQS